MAEAVAKAVAIDGDVTTTEFMGVAEEAGGADDAAGDDADAGGVKERPDNVFRTEFTCEAIASAMENTCDVGIGAALLTLLAATDAVGEALEEADADADAEGVATLLTALLAADITLPAAEVATLAAEEAAELGALTLGLLAVAKDCTKTWVVLGAPATSFPASAAPLCSHPVPTATNCSFSLPLVHITYETSFNCPFIS